MTKHHLLCLLINLPLLLLHEACLSSRRYSAAVMSQDMWLMVVVQDRVALINYVT